MTRLGGLALLLCLAGCTASASGPLVRASLPQGPTPRLFESHEVFALTLSAPLASAFADDGDERDYRPGVLSYADSSAAPVEIELGVRTRGFYRREHCSFPPLRLNLKKKQAEGTAFAGQDKLKLVTHCRGSTRYQHYVLQEYLIYRSYNLLSDRSYRVRLVELDYIDSEGRRDPTTKNGVLIEDRSDLAKRNGLSTLDVPSVRLADLDPEALALLGVFEYMIGGTDWSATRGAAGDDCCHNTKPFADGRGRVIPVAYDFDFTGAVSAHYAEPNPELSIRSVRQRLYRGYCRSNEHLPAVFALMNTRREAIYQLYRSQGGLDPGRMQRTLSYYDEFYRIINDPEQVRTKIIAKCR